MDGREAMPMTFSGGPASYFIHSGGGAAGSGSGTQTEGFQAPSGFRHANSRGGSVGSTFSVEPQTRDDFSHGIGMSIGASYGAPSSGESVKKKRGRPRKYGPDGPVSLKLSPLSATASSTSGSTSPSQKRSRGRPPGSGRKQRLASLGEWMNSSAGLAFSPHVISIGAGEDIVAKLLLMSQQRPRALCILSGTGTVSSVTLRQPASTNASISLEGRFQILCLSGSYLVAEEGGTSTRTGGISVSLSSPDGQVVGGGVAVLIAGSPVQVVVCSFVYGGSKSSKTKQGTSTKDESSSEPQPCDKLTSLASAPPQNYNIWPGPSRPADLKSTQTHTGILALT